MRQSRNCRKSVSHTNLWSLIVIDTLYITDLDGTLLMPDARVSAETRALLLPLLEAGLPLSCATARTSYSVMQILDGLPMKLPLILQNGSVLHDPQTDRIVYGAEIAHQAFMELTELIASFGFNGFVFCVPEDTLVCCYTKLSTAHMRTYYEARKGQFGKPFLQMDSMKDIAGMHPVFLSLHAEKAVLDPFYNAVRQISGISVSYYQDVYEPEIWYIEMSAPDASKYHGILRLKEMTGAKRVVGFGDNLNDLPLFAACDLKIAVGNAADALKAQADLIIGCNTDNAVAKYLANAFRISGG